LVSSSSSSYTIKTVVQVCRPLFYWVILIDRNLNVLEGIFPRELGRALAEAKAARETYEYSATMEIEREEAEALLRDAEKFVARVKSLLKSLKPRATQDVAGSGAGKARVPRDEASVGSYAIGGRLRSLRHAVLG
jgi:hypothetical protein